MRIKQHVLIRWWWWFLLSQYFQYSQNKSSDWKSSGVFVLRIYQLVLLGLPLKSLCQRQKSASFTVQTEDHEYRTPLHHKSPPLSSPFFFFLVIDPGRGCPGASSGCGSGCPTLSSPCLIHSLVYNGQPWDINRTQPSMSKNMKLRGCGFFCTWGYFRLNARPLLRHFSQLVWCGNRCLVKPV